MDSGIILILVLLALCIYVCIHYCIVRDDILYYKMEIERAGNQRERKMWKKRLLYIYLNFIPYLGTLVKKIW